jgi:type I restriction enzyme S subunit
MIDGLKPYPKMKDSGVPWLGEVPEHWPTLPLKHWVRMNRAVLPEDTPPGYEFRYVDIGSVGTGVLTARPQRLRFAAAPSRARRVVRNGDTIVSTVRTYLKAVYFVDAESDDLVCSTGFAVLTPPTSSVPKFVSYVCQSNAFTDWVTAESVGIAYPAIAETRLGAFHVAVPPLPEQAAIVRFLDHADRRIRRYIRAKQKLIKLLEEQKQAIIHRAVTRGLDPNVRLKPSGVEWLGDVPEHWEELPLKRVSRLDNSGNYGVEPEQGEEVLPVATTAQIDRDGRFDVARMPRRGFSRAEVGRYGCRPGDILVVKSSGSIFNVISGKAGIVRSDTPRFIFSNFLMRIVADPAAIEPEYLFLLLSGYLTRERVKRMVAGTTYPNLRVGEYMSALVPVPPISEQRSITSAVSMMTTAVDHAVRSARTEIDLLREYRTRLIADVVTGKLDVREAAARLPDEAEEPELPDEIEAEGDADDAGVGDADEMIEEAET